MSGSLSKSQKDGQNNNSTAELLLCMTNGENNTGVENNSSGRTTTNANNISSKESPDPDKMKTATEGTDNVAYKVMGQCLM